MNTRGLLVLSGMLLGLVFYAFSSSQNNKNTMITTTMNGLDGADVYQENFSTFRYYIETIGVVSIDEVHLEQGKLTALYSYRQGKKVRHVVSELDLDQDGIYKGTCTTKVDNKILFAVNTWLTFNDDGTAVGNWSWSGQPSKNDPIVKISKL